MQSPKRDAFSAPLPPALIYAAALTCGVLAALALEIYLTGAGFDPANLWENSLSSGTRDLRTAGPWWGIAALALDRKDTRLNSSPQILSYTVFCLKTKSN